MQNKIQRNTGRKGQRQHIASPFLIKLLYWRKWFILGHSIFSLPVGGQSCRQAVLLINAMLLLPLNQPKGSTSLRQVQQKRVSKLDGIETPSTTAGPLALASWLTHINLQVVFCSGIPPPPQVFTTCCYCSVQAAEQYPSGHDWVSEWETIPQEGSTIRKGHEDVPQQSRDAAGKKCNPHNLNTQSPVLVTREGSISVSRNSSITGRNNTKILPHFLIAFFNRSPWI